MNLFMQVFNTYADWAAGSKAVPKNAIYFNNVGALLETGRDFLLAKQSNAFPVRWVAPEQVGSIMLWSIGCRKLKYDAEVLLVCVKAFISDGQPIYEKPIAEVNALEATLRLMDRIGTPAAADGLHLIMMQALLVEETRAIVGTLKDIIRDVDTWKVASSGEWAALLAPKLQALEDKFNGLDRE